MKQKTFELMASVAAQIELETRRETIDKVIDILIERQDAINELLDTAEGRRILSMSTGERAIKLYELRSKLYKKMWYLTDIMDAISKLR